MRHTMESEGQQGVSDVALLSTVGVESVSHGVVSKITIGRNGRQRHPRHEETDLHRQLLQYSWKTLT